jgi:hypothetical protein
LPLITDRADHRRPDLAVIHGGVPGVAAVEAATSLIVTPGL